MPHAKQLYYIGLLYKI